MDEEIAKLRGSVHGLQESVSVGVASRETSAILNQKVEDVFQNTFVLLEEQLLNTQRL